MKKWIVIGILFLGSLLVLVGFGIKKNLVLKLNGNKLIQVNYGSPYKELGYKAFYGNKDISKKVKINGYVDNQKLGTYHLKYNIKYGFFKKELTRTIEVVDLEAPVLTLKGANEITIKQGSSYQEPGYKVKDNVDNDLKVEVTGEVNKDKIGTYDIVYKVKDSNGNVTKKKRIVKVEKNETVKKTNSSKGIPVLMYHYFYDKNKNSATDLNSNYMEIHDFEDQLKYLKDNNFYFPTWDELYQYLKGEKSLPDKSVILTSDDGADSFFEFAVPLANKYKVPITSFYIAKKGNKIDKYKSDYIHFESHTYDMHHAGCQGGRGGIFWCIDEEKGIADLKKSIQVVGSDYALAYPYGDVNNNIKTITKKSGVKMAFTIKYGRVKPGMDMLELPRVRMSKGVSLTNFKKMVS